MRWNETQLPEEKPKKEKDKEREIPLSKPGETSLESLQSTKKRPFLGGNYNG